MRICLWPKTSGGGEAFSTSAGSAILRSKKPVSYTHLDVYKRQAYTCYTHFIAPPARGEEGARGSVRVRRVVYLLICALCAAFVLPEWTQTAGYSILSLFA